ncbi:unnamed protein product [Phytophthora fragariaefolia]|uniref:Unnamed protein product n=1 Tax=Phytophthora fragariaefolia TaxID=1490495 RepID=A0A9W6XWL6_9STRA|nr:unnamed protein product [Phytophthora fragariaefolia]
MMEMKLRGVLVCATPRTASAKDGVVPTSHCCVDWCGAHRDYCNWGDGDLHAVVRDDVDLAPVQPDADEALFLVDHAWTFTADKVREQLEAVPPLLERMENLMQLAAEEASELSKEDRVAAVADRVWRYANTYRLGNAKPEDASTIWYVMDEVGSAIEHGDEPNVRMAPFYFAESQCAFSLVWTVQPIEGGDFLSRDYFPEFAADAAMHTALLAALFYEPGKADSPYVEELQEIVAARKNQYTLESARAKFHAIVSRDSETLPDPATTVSSPPLSTIVATQEPLRVCSGEWEPILYLQLVHDNLTHPRFALVDNEEEAQVVWSTRHLKDFPKYANNENVQIINQFPNEKVLTCKDLLYEMCKLLFPSSFAEIWLLMKMAMMMTLPTTGFASPGTWLARLTRVSPKTPPHLARLTETGPKIACKYIHRPLLIDQRKFDFRFLVMVKSTEPLELYLSGVYWLRIANKEFAMDNFQDFEKHFTVMNYTNYAVRIMDNAEFVERFDNEYPSEDWSRVYAEICLSIKKLFEFATAQPPPLGLGRCTKSRALYGVDVMLSWEENEETGDERLRPVILETNFQPDCTRACKYFPQFYNDLMNVLVLNCPENTVHGATRL